MPGRSSTRSHNTNVDSTGEPDDLGDLPEWKRHSIERSLGPARLRAQEQSDRVVAATIEHDEVLGEAQ